MAEGRGSFEDRMHEVLQRTRPAPATSAQSSSKLRTFLRSFLPGKRGLVLLAVVGGATLSSQALMLLLRQGPEAAPGQPARRDGRAESAASGAAASKPADSRPTSGVSGSPDKPDSQQTAEGSPHAAPSSATASSASARRTPRSGPVESIPAARTAALPSLDWRRPWRSGRNASASRDVIADTSSDLPSRPVSAAPVSMPLPRLAASAPRVAPQSPPRRPAPVTAQSGGRQLGSVSLSDLDPSPEVYCSETTASLPSDGPADEAWLPGSDMASALPSAALDPIPVPPIYSESPDQAAGPTPHSLQANRITPCLPKQSAGRN